MQEDFLRLERSHRNKQKQNYVVCKCNHELLLFYDHGLKPCQDDNILEPCMECL